MRLSFLLLLALCISPGGFSQQLFTMSNDCLKKMKTGNRMNDEKKFDSAVAQFNSMGKCDSKDAKEQKAAGLARAYNGKKQYDQAIAQANAALKITKNTSIYGYFERAMAYQGKKMEDSSRADFGRIIQLTEKNQNVKERATIFAVMGDLYNRSGMKDSALMYIDKAMELDPNNANYAIQKGDIYARGGDYPNAFTYYDKAVSLGKTDMEMYQIRTAARMKMVTDKYGTDNAQELRKKMNETERTQLCTEMSQMLAKGYKDMKTDLFAALVCNQ